MKLRNPRCVYLHTTGNFLHRQSALVVEDDDRPLALPQSRKDAEENIGLFAAIA